MYDLRTFIFFILIFISISYANFWCYQESFNESNQTGIDDECSQIYTGSYKSDGTTFNYEPRYYEGTWGPSIGNAAYVTSTGLRNIYVNYTKPAGVGIITEGMMWQTAGYASSTYTETNYTIPTECFDAYAGYVRLYQYYRNGPYYFSQYFCYNGTGWQYLGEHSNSPNLQRAWNEAAWWDINDGIKLVVVNLTQPENTTYTDMLNIPINATCNGTEDSYYLNITANDDTIISDELVENGIPFTTIQNFSTNGGWEINATCWNLTLVNSSDSIIFTVNDTAPIVAAYYPLNESHVPSICAFSYTVNESSGNPINCSIYVDGVAANTTTNITSGDNVTAYVSNMSLGFHTWYVNCTDSSNLSNITPNYTLIVIVEADVLASSISSGGGYIISNSGLLIYGFILILIAIGIYINKSRGALNE